MTFAERFRNRKSIDRVKEAVWVAHHKSPTQAELNKQAELKELQKKNSDEAAKRRVEERIRKKQLKKDAVKISKRLKIKSLFRKGLKLSEKGPHYDRRVPTFFSLEDSVGVYFPGPYNVRYRPGGYSEGSALSYESPSSWDSSYVPIEGSYSYVGIYISGDKIHLGRLKVRENGKYKAPGSKYKAPKDNVFKMSPIEPLGGISYIYDKNNHDVILEGIENWLVKQLTTDRRRGIR